MTESFDPRLRDLLRRIIKRSGQKLSSGALIKEFQRDTISPSVLRQFNEIIKHDSLALNLFETDAETNATNLQKQRPEQWLTTFLEKYIIKVTFYKEIHHATKKANEQTNRTQDEASTADSRISDIFKKVKAAADGYQSQVAATESRNLQQFPIETSRPHSLWYLNKVTHDSLPRSSKVINCAALPIANQENLIINDLIYLFIGITGDYITPVFTAESENGFAPIKFNISDQIDVSLRNIVEDILPMASHFSIVQKFAQWGSRINNQILQALSEALQSILYDYRVSVTQLESEHLNNALNLHKLLYLIRPNMQTLQILAEIAMKISKSDLLGGSILSLLFDEITLQTGDAKAQKMIIDLTERASVPYIEMLELWILKGLNFAILVFFHLKQIIFFIYFRRYH